MRKVFVAFLGTGHPSDCIYYTENDKEKDSNLMTPYIQEHLIKKHCLNWTKNDQIIFFLTEKAKELNWENKHKFFPENTNTPEKKPYKRDGETFRKIDLKEVEKENIGLKQRLEELDIKANIEAVMIKDGKSEDELWSIFNEVFNRFNEKDEVMFDVTHGFRSLSIFMTVLISYLKVTKNITIKNIYYGAFEAADRKDIHKPVFDLNSISKLQDWSIAVSNFIKNGIIQDIKELVFEEEKGAILEIPVLLNTFSKNILTSNLKGILKLDFNKLVGYIELLKGRDASIIKPLNPLFDMLLDKIKPFNVSDDIQKGFCCVKWCIDYNLIQQGYTILNEVILMFFLNFINEKPYKKQEYDIYDYQTVKNLKKNIKNKNHIPNSKIKKEKNLKIDVDNIFYKHRDLSRILPYYEQISKNRNKINHGCMNKDNDDVNSFKKSLQKSYNNIHNIINQFTTQLNKDRGF